MTIPPVRTSAGLVRRTFTVLLAAAVMLPVIGYAFSASTAQQRVALLRQGALLGLQAKSALPSDPLDASAMRTALAASPLSQATANVIMTRQAGNGKKTQTAAWLTVLPRLGWRDTPSLQNLLYDAAQAQDFNRMLDLSDALLRRHQLMEQTFPLIALVEADTAMRRKLIARLVANPNWRDAYLSSTGVLTTRNSLLARFVLLRELQRRGVRLGRDEIIPSINALDLNGLSTYGFALWRSIQPGIHRPLDDPDFAAASLQGQTNDQIVPYEWQLMTGEGFSAGANKDGNATSLEIDWKGRGVPVFAQQRTSAAPGRYALFVSTPAKDQDELKLLNFRLVCDSAPIAFEPTGNGRYVTIDTVPCAYPLLQIVGDVQSFETAHTISINHIAMAPLASVGR